MADRGGRLVGRAQDGRDVLAGLVTGRRTDAPLTARRTRSRSRSMSALRRHRDVERSRQREDRVRNRCAVNALGEELTLADRDTCEGAPWTPQPTELDRRRPQLKVALIGDPRP